MPRKSGSGLVRIAAAAALVPPRTVPPFSLLKLLRVVLLGSSLMGLAGCGWLRGSGGSGISGTPRPVTLADFAPAEPRASATASASQPVAATQVAATHAATMPNMAEIGPAASNPAATQTASTAAASGSAAGAAKPASGEASAKHIEPGEELHKPGDAIIVESVIGQVNGRPIFADKFFDPIADRLRALAEKSNSREFMAGARQIINEHLNEIVLSSLFLAEAENALSEQQEQGLLAFIRNFREESIAESLGNTAQRQSELAAEGITLDQYVEAYRNQTLISNLINEKIRPRVIVSWKDVEREYEQRSAEFNPPARVTLSRIRLSNKDQAALIEQVKARLAAGESFDAVAASVGADAGTIGPLQMGPGGISDIEINEAYKPALKGLALGQTTAAIVTAERTVWLHVQAIDQPPGKTLYDVQLQLLGELNERRLSEERARFINSLFEKGIYDQLGEMSNRLLAVAMLRYGKA